MKKIHECKMYIHYQTLLTWICLPRFSEFHFLSTFAVILSYNKSGGIWIQAPVELLHETPQLLAFLVHWKLYIFDNSTLQLIPWFLYRLRLEKYKIVCFTCHIFIKYFPWNCTYIWRILLSKSESVKFWLIESVSCLFTDSSVKKFFHC